MGAGGGGIQAHQFAGQVKAGDLLLAAVGGGEGLDRAGTNGIDGPELVAHLEQVLAPLQRPALLDDAIQLLQVIMRQLQWQAELEQTAGLTRRLQALQIDNSRLRYTHDKVDSLRGGCPGGILPAGQALRRKKL